MSRYQPYPKYKASGVEWLGDVPEHWEVKRLKNVIRAPITDGPHETPVFIEDGVPFLSVDGIQNGELTFEKCRYISHEAYKTYSKKAFIEVDDILLGKAASIGKVARVKVDFQFSIWSPLALIKPKFSVVNSNYLEFLLKSALTQYQIQQLSTSNTQQNISMADIPKFVFSIPDIAEQTAIANFLDTQTTKIDTLIAKQQRMIELLSEKRQALISHAVTKGLNPDAPMKDSGVAWLGDVPENWGVYKLKYAVDRIGDVDHFMPKSIPFGKPYMMTGDMCEKASLIDFSNCKQISEEDFAQLSQKIKPSIGDVIFARYATIGTVCYVDIEEDFIVSYSCVIIKPNSQKVLGKYLTYFYKSNFFIENIKSSINSNTQGNVGIDSLYSTLVILPSIDEQNLIIQFIEEKTTKIDDLISKAKQVIALLQERRSSLISAAVTGKIDVRNSA